MDHFAYWATAEAGLAVQNPIHADKLRLIETYCGLRDGMQVLDVGCGKAWLLRDWARRIAIAGTGVERNPLFLVEARRAAQGGPAAHRLTFVESDAAAFQPRPEGYHLTLCLGAAFALGGFDPAVDWLAAATKPGGWAVIGDLVLRHRPMFPPDELLPHDLVSANAVATRHGLAVLAVISASEEDFERYACAHWHAINLWAAAHPDDPERSAWLTRARRDWDYYLEFVRPHLGWTVWLCRKAGG